MIALGEGKTLRTLGVNASRLETYFEARPEYAREEGPRHAANPLLRSSGAAEAATPTNP
jgi:hypothetical protein